MTAKTLTGDFIFTEYKGKSKGTFSVIGFFDEHDLMKEFIITIPEQEIVKTGYLLCGEFQQYDENKVPLRDEKGYLISAYEERECGKGTVVIPETVFECTKNGKHRLGHFQDFLDVRGFNKQCGDLVSFLDENGFYKNWIDAYYYEESEWDVE